MSRLRIFQDSQPETVLLETHSHTQIREQMAEVGIGFEAWATYTLPDDISTEGILAAYDTEIKRLVAENGFNSVDVVYLKPDNVQREAMRAKFLDEHCHHEDEVRFFVAGSGQFSLHIQDKVYEIICQAGDLIRVPDNTKHWFDMGPEPYFTAIRFFTEADGWIGYFTDSGIATQFPRYEVTP
jgi:1,2-dihydroxy-3-keto-5-methylthiopentene dioxygenase